jgi:hypothetical protein
MRSVSFKRLGVTLVSLAVPFMIAAPVAAQPSPAEVANVHGACQALAYPLHTCTGAVEEGVIEVVEEGVKSDLADQGIDFALDIGAPELSEPDNLQASIDAIAVNPLPPLPPAPLTPAAPYVPYQ